MDIEVSGDIGKFKLRSCGVIVRDGKMLVDRGRNFAGHVFLGGHVTVGENSRDTIVREAKEELGVDVTIEKLLCVNENIYEIPTTKNVAHEVAFYYMLETKDILPNEDFEVVENDNGTIITHRYSWVDLNKASECNVRPNWIAEMILENKENYYYLTDNTRQNNE